MRKRLITGAVAVCLLLGISVTAFAAEEPLFPFAGDGVSKTDTFRLNKEERMEALNERLSDLKEEVAVAMSAYEQYGLVYDQDKGGYFYEGKLVGLFVDPQGRGVSYLSKNGEVHMKAVRDDKGALTGLAELSEDEYDKIVSELKNIKSGIQEYVGKKYSKIREQVKSKTYKYGGFDRDLSDIRESRQEQRGQLRADMKGRWKDILNKVE